LDAALRVQKYIKGTLGQGLLLPFNNDLKMKVYWIQIGEDVVLLEDQSTTISFSWEIHWYPGSQGHQAKQNIGSWQMLV